MVYYIITYVITTIFICQQFVESAFLVTSGLRNISLLTHIPGLESMSSDKYPHFTLIETVSRTKFHVDDDKNHVFLSQKRKKRQVIAGQLYEWQSNEIAYQIWGGDRRYF